jgi:hypothetical protein
MKKLLLTALTGFIGFSVYAQSINILDANQNVINNGTIDLWVDVNNGAPYADFDVKNVATGSKSIKCMRHIVSEVNGTSNVICWYVCYSPPVSTSASVLMPTNTTHLFTSHYYPAGMTGTTTILYSFWDSLNVADSAHFTVNWHVTLASVKNLDAISGNISNLFPNPASSSATISYQLSAAPENAVVRVFNLLGDEVKHFNVSNKEGNITIPVGDLEAGLYFCSFVANDKIIATRKLTVTR